MSTTISTTAIGTTVLVTTLLTTLTTTVIPTTTQPPVIVPPVTQPPDNTDTESKECIPCYPEIPTTNTPPPIPIPTTLNGSPININRREPDIVTILVNHSTTTPIIKTGTITTTVQSPTIVSLPIIHINNNECDFNCQQLKF